MNIDELINKYFEGETSCEEEQSLRTFFASENVPEHLMVYRPMFAYFDEEIRKNAPRKELRITPFRRILYAASAVAACLLLIVGVRYLTVEEDPCLCSGNYVVINGRCYTDMETVKELAFEALQEVATPADEYFPFFSDDE